MRLDPRPAPRVERVVRRGAGRCFLTPLALCLAAAGLAAVPARVLAQQPVPPDAAPRLLMPEPAPRVWLADPAYAANAAVARIVVEVARNHVPADGQSPVEVTVRLFGADGQPLAGRAFATVEVGAGRVQLPGARTDEAGPRGADADRVRRGVQLPVDGGRARLLWLAPAEPQAAELRVTAGAEQASGRVSFLPEQRPFVAAGLVEGILNFRGRTPISPVREGDGFEREIRAWARSFEGGRANVGARAALFLKGTIRGDWLLTAAYDSDKDTRARLLRDIRPDELYPVYGDSALKSFDARSAQRLYVRLDRDRSYAMFGDFVTGDGFTQPIGQGGVASLALRSLGHYNRSATGLRAHHETGSLVANAFVFNDTLRQVVEEFASQGSGPYALRNGAVLEGSDKLEVLVRDRNQPSRIVSVRPLARLVDYSFEPFSGRILLASFLPAFDAELNPVSLRVSYELDQGGEAFWVGGVDLQWKLGELLGGGAAAGLEIGGSAVEDRNPLAPYRLLSANASWRLAPRTVLVVEAAESRSSVNTNPANLRGAPGFAGLAGEVSGRAGRVELAHEGERSDARLFFGRSSPLFDNPAAPLQGGRDELFAKASVAVGPGLRAYGEALASEDRTAGGGRLAAGGLGLRWQALERLTLDLSLRELRETVGVRATQLASAPFGQTAGLTGSIATGAAGGALGWSALALDPATGLPVLGANALAPAASRLPVGTRLESRSLRLGAGWRANERLTLLAEAESSLDGDDRRRVAAGADVAVAERTRLYGRWEHQSGWVQLAGVSDTGRSARALVFGVDSSHFADTQLFSEYRLRDAIAGRDLQLASGARHAWDLAEGWRVSAAAERVRVLSGESAAATAIAAGLDWTAHDLWRASTRLEWRLSDDLPGTTEDERFTTTLWQATVARKLSRDWTLLARNHLLATDYRARGDVLQDRAQLGLAYRDTDTNRVNALGKVEYKLERDASNAAVGTLESRAWIASTHADWHPSRPWWMTGRVAAKWQRDRFENGVADEFKAALVAGRMVWDVTERWDLGLLAAAQFGQRGARQTAWGGEVGYLLRQNLWLSAGFNAAGFAGDADLVGYEYTRRGAYLRLRFKFDEDLWKGRDPEVNRSLPR